jgi:hypothetical protein
LEVFRRLRNLNLLRCSLEVSEEAQVFAGVADSKGLLSYGYSRDHRPDKLQTIVEIS